MLLTILISVNKGITAIIGNKLTTEDDLALSESLLNAVGRTLRLENEEQMDAVTAVSGSGPAYVFYLIEALAKAGEVHSSPGMGGANFARPRRPVPTDDLYQELPRLNIVVSTSPI